MLSSHAASNDGVRDYRREESQDPRPRHSNAVAPSLNTSNSDRGSAMPLDQASSRDRENEMGKGSTQADLARADIIPRDTVLRAFSPRVAVYASQDTEDLIRLKGVYGGLCGILRPFGECVQGKVVVRDSSGASKSWNDFGVHFVDFKAQYGDEHTTSSDCRTNEAEGSTDTQDTAKGDQMLHAVDQVLRHHMVPSESSDPDIPVEAAIENGFSQDQNEGIGTSSTGFALLLRKLLSGRPMTPHEMFTHPVTCIIAISSQNSAPIETLRDLYNDTRQGGPNLPPWISTEFLRYYVLVHDEDHDDFAKSMTLFNQMKRHFGLHCHLLRLRSKQCLSDSPDNSQLPPCLWLAAEEDVYDMKQKGGEAEAADFQQYLFDSEVSVIRSFIREMVTQSVIPFMEGRVASWNDQVASRRKGISGRFMSLSKRWTGFGTGRGAKTTTSGASSSSNYDSTRCAYNSDTPESTMHRLADYALMLRDWKMSASIYDILRTDFADDKAWYHHAVVNEMLAVSLLLGAQADSGKSKFDMIDHSADTATYSYLTRCTDIYRAIRCLILITELYRNIGTSGAESSAKWAQRLLELSILSPLTQSIMAERLLANYTLYSTTGAEDWKSGSRKAAFWCFMSSRLWLKLDMPVLADRQLRAAGRYYALEEREGMLPFSVMQECWEDTRRNIHMGAFSSKLFAVQGIPAESHVLGVDEQQETFATTNVLSHQKRFSTSVQTQTDLADLMERLNVPTEAHDDGFV